MKKCILLFIAIIGLSTQFSCTDYLDKAPESGLSEEDVFTKHVNFKKFFYTVYGELGSTLWAGGINRTG